MPLKWEAITNWQAFQAMVGMIVQVENQTLDRRGKGHARWGKDFKIDAWVENAAGQKTTVVGAKFSKGNPPPNWRTILKKEFAGIAHIRTDSAKAGHQEWQHVTSYIVAIGWQAGSEGHTEIRQLWSEQCASIGISLDVWDRDALEGMLTRPEHSHTARFFGLADHPWHGVLPWPLFLNGLVVPSAGDFLLKDKLPLIDRDEEISALTTFLHGGDQVCIMHGPTGWGRTRLALESASLAGSKGRNAYWVEQGLFRAEDPPQFDKPVLLVVDDFDLWEEAKQLEFIKYLQQLLGASVDTKALFVLRSDSLRDRAFLKSAFSRNTEIIVRRADDLPAEGRGWASLPDLIAYGFVNQDAARSYQLARTFDSPSAMVTFLDLSLKGHALSTLAEIAAFKVETVLDTFAPEQRTEARKVLEIIALLSSFNTCRDKQLIIDLAGVTPDLFERVTVQLREMGFLKQRGDLMTTEPRFLAALLALEAAISRLDNRPQPHLLELLRADEEIVKRVVKNLALAGLLLKDVSRVRPVFTALVETLRGCDNYGRYQRLKALAHVGCVCPEVALLGLRIILDNPRTQPDTGPGGIVGMCHKTVLKETGQVFEPLLAQPQVCGEAFGLLWNHWCEEMRSMYRNYQPKDLVGYHEFQEQMEAGRVYQPQVIMSEKLLQLLGTATVFQAKLALECASAWLEIVCETSGSISKHTFTVGTRGLVSDATLDACRKNAVEIAALVAGRSESSLRKSAFDVLHDAFLPQRRLRGAKGLQDEERATIMERMVNIISKESDPGTIHHMATVFDLNLKHSKGALGIHKTKWIEAKKAAFDKPRVGLFSLFFGHERDDELTLPQLADIVMKEVEGNAVKAVELVGELAAPSEPGWWYGSVSGVVFWLAQRSPKESWAAFALAVKKGLSAYAGAMYAGWRVDSPSGFFEKAKGIAEETGTLPGLAAYGSKYHLRAHKLSPEQDDIELLVSMPVTCAKETIESLAWAGPADQVRSLDKITSLATEYGLARAQELYAAIADSLAPLGKLWVTSRDAEEAAFRLLEEVFVHIACLDMGNVLYDFRKFYGCVLHWNALRAIRFFKKRVELSEGRGRDYEPIPHSADALIPEDLPAETRAEIMTEMMTWDISKSAGAKVYHPHLYAGLFRNHQDAVADAVGKRIESAPDELTLDRYMAAIQAVPDSEAKMRMVFEAVHRAEQLDIAAECGVRWGLRAYGRGAFSGNGDEHYAGIIRTIDNVRQLFPAAKVTVYLDGVLDRWRTALREELAAMRKHDEEMELED